MINPLKYKWKFFLLITSICIAIAIGVVVSLKDKPTAPMAVTLAHDKGNFPLFQNNFLKQGAMALKRTGISINPAPSLMPDLFRHQMKASLPTKEAPELFTWWSTYRVKELVDDNFVMDMTTLWDKHKDDYPPETREAFTFDGKVYGFPYAIEYWPVWYNKKIFKRLGLEAPSTWPEFIRVCNTLKKSGIPPILSSLQYGWPSFIWFEEMVMGESPDLYEGLCLGKVKYTDPRVVKACLIWKDMIEKGFFTDPSLNMLTNTGYLWNNEKFAMALCGTWYYSAVLMPQGVNEEDIGFFILPSHNPDAGKNIIFEVGPLFISKNAANTDAALKIADWWMGAEGNAYFASNQNAYPSNQNTDISYLPKIQRDLSAAMKNGNYRVLNRYWEATPSPICDTAVIKLGEFILNPKNVNTILEDIQRSADLYWADNTPAP